MWPVAVEIQGSSGAMHPSTRQFARRLSDLRGVFQDVEAFESAVIDRGDPIVYEVVEYRAEGSDLLFGTTTMFPGRVGGEHHATRGHAHARDDRGEVYYVQAGCGVLILESQTGEARSLTLQPGTCALIPPGWAHRSVVTGHDPLVFMWVCGADAGHRYEAIPASGMRLLVVDEDGVAVVRPNPTRVAESVSGG